MSDLREELENLIAYVERNECTHEQTHRGGAIWTICDDCDRKWSDDRDPFAPYKEPAVLTAARAALSAQPQPEAVEAVGRDFWMHYDHQTGKWCVEEQPPKVIRTGAEIIHAREVSTTPPLAPDERMLRALERELIDCQSAVDTIEHYRDTSNETQNGNYRFYQGSVASLKFALQALSGADEASAASAEARLREKLVRNLGSYLRVLKGVKEQKESMSVWSVDIELIERAIAALSAGGDEATKSEGGINWTPFEDGTAPWSEDEQFEEAAKACKSRCKKFGKGTCDGAFEGNCTECERDAEIVLRRKYLKPSRPSDTTAAPAAVDVEAVSALVKRAYNEGFTEGGREFSSRKGGTPWSEACAYYEKRILSLLNASDAERAR